MSSALSDLWRYAVRHRPRIVASSIYSILNRLFDIAPEILIGVAIDIVVSREQSFLAQLGVVELMDQFLLLGVLTLLIWVLESIFEYFYLIGWRNLAQRIQHDLRIDTYAHVQNLDLSYFEDRSTGGLTAVLNDDINQLERFLNNGANSLIQVFTTIVMVGVVFVALSPLIALLAFAPIPIIVWGAFRFQRRAQPLYDDVREKVAVLSGRLNGNLSGITTIKSFTAEGRELERLKQDSEAYCEANRKAIAVSSAFIPIIRMAVLAGFVLTLLVGGWQALSGDLRVGFFGVLVFLTQRLLWPLTGLAETVDLYERAMASTRRILKLLHTPLETHNIGRTLDPAGVRGDLEFRDVSFSYGPESSVLQKVSVSVPAGRTIALVGPTGSGKSTLMKLLLRFYKPQSGEILLDGRNIQDFRPEDLRHCIGLVSQDVFLFQGTVRDNIAYGRPAASFEDIRNAASIAEAHEFIEALPQGYDTPIGERGQKLSGGQRQRLSIARALLKDPPIMILDEATSSVDNETEAAIQRSLSRLTRGRTTLIIAHRLSSVVHADQILVLDGGRIVERGSSAELLATGGLYHSFWQVQIAAQAERNPQR